jgi:hypothetical protein
MEVLEQEVMAEWAAKAEAVVMLEQLVLARQVERVEPGGQEVSLRAPTMLGYLRSCADQFAPLAEVRQSEKSAQIVIAGELRLRDSHDMTNRREDLPAFRRPPHESKIRVFTFVAWICVILGLLTGILGAFRMWQEVGGNFSKIKLGDLGNFGSYLQGAVQSLWSLAAFLFIYVAFLGQKQQIRLQADQFDFEQSRQAEQFRQQQAELEDQRRQFQLQQDSIKRQNFENSFFQLLNLQNQLVGEMQHGTAHGKQVFSLWARFFDQAYYEWFRRRSGGKPPSEIHRMQKELMIEFFEEYYKNKESEMAHYFRNLYHIFKFVKLSDVEPKRRYTSLVRAQLSKYELLFLFYNCLTRYGHGFKPLIEEFGLFEHLDPNVLLHESNKAFYSENAYK